MITVFRIYFGRAWAAAADGTALQGLFDDLPEFLYRMVEVEADAVAAAEASGDEALGGLVRIAMTHAHVVVLRGSERDPAPRWTEQELVVAQGRLRRPLPVLVVVPPGEQAPPALAAIADQVVAWNGPEIARAIKTLAENSAARRSALAGREVPQPAASRAVMRGSDGDGAVARDTRHAAPREAPTGDAARTLPTAEIIAAYLSLKDARSGTPPQETC